MLDKTSGRISTTDSYMYGEEEELGNLPIITILYNALSFVNFSILYNVTLLTSLLISMASVHVPFRFRSDSLLMPKVQSPAKLPTSAFLAPARA